MGRKSLTVGVRAKGPDRIQFDFEYQGRRYRPTLKRIPSEANLRRAHVQLKEIKRRIALGTFVFAEEFPEFRDLHTFAPVEAPRTCNQVFDEFMVHNEARMAKTDLAFATVESYRKILESTWRPAIGELIFEEVKYSTLAKIIDAKLEISKKTHNNIVSVIRCAFEYGYRDHPGKSNPASVLKCFRLTKKDRPAPDPFSIQEAEALIAAIHRDWGEAQGNYDEFRFFTGLRPSEQFALLVEDCDLEQGKLKVTKARVMNRDKDRTKTGVDRIVELCPRALEVLKRQLALRERMKQAGRIKHDHLFFRANGKPFGLIRHPYDRWRWSLSMTVKGRYREPYNARHSFVSWNLMLGKNLLWVAKQHGHSVQTMLDTYATWIDGSQQEDIEAIRQAMERRPATLLTGPAEPTLEVDPQASLPPTQRFGTGLALEPRYECVTRGMLREMYGGKGGTRTLDPGIMSAVL